MLRRYEQRGMADNFAQIVKQQADIVKIVGDYVRLKKSGAQNYAGLCPFHKEKSPSFSVNAVKQFYHCFGCGEGGDVFSFVMKMETISFPEAVRSVAAKAGVPLPKKDFSSPEEAREARLRRQLMEIHEGATQYFEGMLKSPEAARAREYLTGRGVAAEALAKFRIGYAPESFNDMRDRLKPHFSEDVMRASGLFSAKENEDGSYGQVYARFRRRITFPIINEQGKPIAFTARALEDVDDKGRPVAKYMNSPETALYTKGNVLFNLDKAKAGMKAHDFVLLVEGQMDCISVYMAGVQNVIATSGTAFTEMQVRQLGRFTKRVVLNFDPDQAGVNAAEKSIALLTEEDFEIKVIALDGGLDPDRFVRERGIQAYMAALRGAQRYSDYLIERARQQFPQRTAESKVKAMNFLLPYIRKMPDPLRRKEFVADVTQKLGIDSAILLQDLEHAASKRLESMPIKMMQPISETEVTLLQALISVETDPDRLEAVARLLEHPEWYEGLATSAVIETLVHAPAPSNPLDAAPDATSRSQLAKAIEMSQSHDGISSGITPKPKTRKVLDALLDLERRSLERKQIELRVILTEAVRRGDVEIEKKLEIETIQVMRQLNKFRTGD